MSIGIIININLTAEVPSFTRKVELGILDRYAKEKKQERAVCKKIKAGRRWETLVGYTLKELMEHLESKFEPWMNWGNYGAYEEERLKWHIDHIRPKSLFIFISPEDKEFKECWALENLQPLEAIKNIQKSNNYQLFEEDIREVGR